MTSISTINRKSWRLVDPDNPYIDISGDLLTPYEWVIDNFIYAGAMNIAGTHGAGKTTSLVPIAMAVCGAIKYESIEVSVRRKVIYIAEDTDQVKRMLHAAIEHQGVDPVYIKEWFKVRQAKRVGVEVHEELAVLARECVEMVDEQPVYPLIVYDTAAANFSVENENDNAIASRVVASIRHTLNGFPLWIVTHTSKSIVRGDLSSLSSRGATAWEADVQGVFYLFVDEDEQTRVLYGGPPVKRRDHGSIKEISLHGRVFADTRTDRFGKRQKVPYIVIDAEVSSKELREQKADQVKEEKREQKLNEIKRAVLGYIEKQKDLRVQGNQHLSVFYPTKKSITDSLKKDHGRDLVREAIDELINDGQLITAKQTIMRESGKPYPKTYLEKI